MANLMLAPVWSMGWKVAIIVILAFLLFIVRCAGCLHNRNPQAR